MSRGSPLAHFGMFDWPGAQLVEAPLLFEEHLNHDAVLTVRAMLDEIAKQSLSQSGHGQRL